VDVREPVADTLLVSLPLAVDVTLEVWDELAVSELLGVDVRDPVAVTLLVSLPLAVEVMLEV
jgi:hypothetical protein